jgi:integrase
MRRKGDTKPRKDEIDPFSAEERAAILNTATGQERNLLQFAFWTGLRISELCAPDWGDVDWRGKRIFVQRALTPHSTEPETPKTTAGERYVKLLPAALEALKAQKAHSFLTGEEIFRNPRTHKRWTGDMVIRERMWKRILLRAGVRYRYPYQMRHTYASMMLQAGESVMWVAQQMGHTDWTFTARTYSRWVSIDAPEAGSLAAENWG